MTLPFFPATASSARDRGLTGPAPIVLAAAGQRLLARGCSAEPADVGGCGVHDVRLLVGRADRPVAVEVLGPSDGAGDPGRWHAVRVDPDGVRWVWAGPARSCSVEELAAFVDGLLSDDQRLLVGRYLAVG